MMEKAFHDERETVTELTPIDRESGEPLYAQIADALRAQIESGARPPGAALPSEQALQDGYGVARSVIRQALDVLAGEGLVSRERGRGTIVLPPQRYRRAARQAGGLTQQIAAEGGQLTTRVVSLDVAVAPAEKKDLLGDAPAWRLERVRSVDGKPLIHMVTWIPKDLTPTLTAEELDGGSLHDWMRAHGLQPAGGPRQLHAVAASAETAAFLDVSPGSPVTLLEGVTEDQLGRPIEAFSAWHHPTTVFDLDARVDRAAKETRAQQLIDELRALLADR